MVLDGFAWRQRRVLSPKGSYGFECRASWIREVVTTPSVVGRPAVVPFVLSGYRIEYYGRYSVGALPDYLEARNTMKIISWNMAHRHEPWRHLLNLNLDVDLALLQEAGEPPPDVAKRIGDNPAIEVDSAPWETMIVGCRPSFRTAIVKLSDRIEVDWIETKSLDTAGTGELVASWPGTLAVASVTPPSGEPVIAVSMYAPWVRAHALTRGTSIISDGSAHRIVSDLSTLIAKENGHRVLAAGDMNILRGYGEYGDEYWAARYRTVFDRMEIMGLPCVGPEFPNGRQADPWPDELPRDSRIVPTFHSNRKSPETATRQLDYVFASTELAESLTVQALNAPDKWGPSDHCQIEIELAPGA